MSKLIVKTNLETNFFLARFFFRKCGN